MTPDQVGEIEPGDLAVLDDPAPADHDAVGAVGAAENQRRQRIAAAGKAQFVELEQGEIGHLADGDLANVAAAGASCRALGCPAQRVKPPYPAAISTASLQQERSVHLTD